MVEPFAKKTNGEDETDDDHAFDHEQLLWQRPDNRIRIGIKDPVVVVKENAMKPVKSKVKIDQD